MLLKYVHVLRSPVSGYCLNRVQAIRSRSRSRSICSLISTCKLNQTSSLEHTTRNTACAAVSRLCKLGSVVECQRFGFARYFKSSDSYWQHHSNSRDGALQTVDAVCRKWTDTLEKNGIPEPLVSVEFIVAYVLGKKTLFDVSTEHELTEENVELVNTFCQQRLHHKPVQYIIGEWDFHDIELMMRSPVFIPRPETEELVSQAIQMLKNRDKCDGHLLEFCCGSGAVILSLLHKFPLLRGVAVDVLPEACSLTEENAQQLGLSDRITVLLGDLIDSSVQERLKELAPFDMLVSNPPYVSTGQMSSLDTQILQYEDHRALHGGADGLDVVRHILHLSPHLLSSDSDILLEIQPGQPELIRDIVTSMEQSGLRYVGSYQDYLDRNGFVICVHCCVEGLRKKDSSGVLHSIPG